MNEAARPEEGFTVLSSTGAETQAALSTLLPCAILDVLPAEVALLDRNGTTVAVNTTWTRAADDGADIPRPKVGESYLAACEATQGACAGTAAAVVGGLRAILAGARDRFALEHPAQCAGTERWLQLVATPLPGGQGCIVMRHDITDRKRAEAALRASEGRFRSLVLNMRDIIFCRGVQGDAAHGYTSSGAAVFGADAARLAGTVDEQGQARIDVWYDAVHPEDRSSYLEAERRWKEHHEPYTIEYRITHPGTGEARWMREVGWVVEEAELGQTYFDSYILDITKQKRSEEALAASKARLRALFDNALDAIFVANEAGTLLDLNPAACRLLGSTRDALAGRPLAGLLRSEDASRLPGGWGDLQPGVPHRGEWLLLRSDGAPVPVEINASTLPDGRLLAVARDITERRRAEAAARESELRLQRIIQSDAVGMVVLDPSGQIREANDAFLALVGHARGEIQDGGLNLIAMVPPEHRHLSATLLATALRARRQRPFEAEFVRPDGRRVGVLLGAAHLGGGEPLCFALVTDLSDRRAAERHRLLLQELNHRVKNTLATVQAIASQTGRGADSIGSFLDAFRGRLRALGAAHDLLVARGWEGAVLEELLGCALRPHLSHARPLALELPELVLRPQAAQDLALAVHELATNATKHGALSVPTGRVTLTGRIEGRALILVWQETGGPPVMPPTRHGFGTTLLSQAIQHQHKGRLGLEWRPEGLVCTMTLPLATVAERQRRRPG